MPSLYGDHCCPAELLQPERKIGLPSVLSEFWLVRQLPFCPVSAPVAVAVPAGVELPPCS